MCDFQAKICAPSLWNRNSRAWNRNSRAWNRNSEGWNCNSRGWNRTLKAWNRNSKGLEYAPEAWNCDSSLWNCDSKGKECDSKPLERNSKPLDRAPEGFCRTGLGQYREWSRVGRMCISCARPRTLMVLTITVRGANTYAQAARHRLIYDSRRLVVVQLECERCRNSQDLYFALAV